MCSRLTNNCIDLVGATQLKHRVCYGGVPALHTAVDVAIKCPSGLLSAHFLAHSCFRDHLFITVLPCAKLWRRAVWV
jgi:hypothetical protein